MENAGVLYPASKPDLADRCADTVSSSRDLSSGNSNSTSATGDYDRVASELSLEDIPTLYSLLSPGDGSNGGMGVGLCDDAQDLMTSSLAPFMRDDECWTDPAQCRKERNSEVTSARTPRCCTPYQGSPERSSENWTVDRNTLQEVSKSIIEERSPETLERNSSDEKDPREAVDPDVFPDEQATSRIAEADCVFGEDLESFSVEEEGPGLEEDEYAEEPEGFRAISDESNRGDGMENSYKEKDESVDSAANEVHNENDMVSVEQDETAQGTPGTVDKERAEPAAVKMSVYGKPEDTNVCLKVEPEEEEADTDGEEPGKTDEKLAEVDEERPSGRVEEEPGKTGEDDRAKTGERGLSSPTEDDSPKTCDGGKREVKDKDADAPPRSLFGLKITSVSTLAPPQDESPLLLESIKCEEDFEVEIEPAPEPVDDDMGEEEEELETETTSKSASGETTPAVPTGGMTMLESFHSFLSEKMRPQPHNTATYHSVKHPIELRKDPDEKESYTCHQCSKVFQTRALFRRHRSRTHAKNFILQLDDVGPQTHCNRCSLCSKGFIGKAHLMNHRRSVHGVHVMDESKCGVCFAVFSSPVERFTHELSDHGLKVDEEIRSGRPATALPPRASVVVQSRPAHVLKPVRTYSQVRQTLVVRRKSPPNGHQQLTQRPQMPGVRPARMPAPPQKLPTPGRISVRPAHVLQAVPPPTSSGPPMLGPRFQMTAPRGVHGAMANGYGVYTTKHPGQAAGPVYYVMTPPGSSVSAAPPQVPRTFLCATCHSEFSTALNLKLHARAMDHELPPDIDDSIDGSGAESVMGLILGAPGAGVGDEEEEEEEVGSSAVNGVPSASQPVADSASRAESWVKGRTEIRKRKVAGGRSKQAEANDVVVLDDDEDAPSAANSPSPNEPPLKVLKVSAPAARKVPVNAEMPSLPAAKTSCPVCPKGPTNIFTSPSHLLIHMRIAHRDKRIPAPGPLHKQRLLPPNQRKDGQAIRPVTNPANIEVIDLA